VPAIAALPPRTNPMRKQGSRLSTGAPFRGLRNRADPQFAICNSRFAICICSAHPLLCAGLPTPHPACASRADSPLTVHHSPPAKRLLTPQTPTPKPRCLRPACASQQLSADQLRWLCHRRASSIDAPLPVGPPNTTARLTKDRQKASHAQSKQNLTAGFPMSLSETVR
jgi:hypothetical protein